MASVAVAIALPMKYVNRPGNQPTINDVITFDSNYKASLSEVGDTTDVSANSSDGRKITLTATIDSVPVTDTDVFNPADGKVTYKGDTFANKTIVIKASDGQASVEPTINIGFGAIPPATKTIQGSINAPLFIDHPDVKTTLSVSTTDGADIEHINIPVVSGLTFDS
ncbi:hypothetical protein FACS1894166_07310 [Bacilli bacterium]|nr:hypothetical protein FACS1894166_07310 [Bacilli bacterium]